MRRILFAVALAGLSTMSYAAGFKLSSPEIKANHMIPKRFEFNGFRSEGVLRTGKRHLLFPN